MNKLYVSIIVFLALMLGVFIGRSVYPVEVQMETITIDTLYIAQDPIYIKGDATTDTVFVEIDGDTVMAEIATLDTVLAEGHLKIQYTSVIKEFDLSWTPVMVPVIKETITEIVVKQTVWYKKPEIMFLVGALFTGTIVSLVNG